MERVKIRLTAEGAAANQGTDLARVGQLDAEGNLTFKAACLTPVADGYQVITDNPHIFYIPSWAVAGTSQPLRADSAAS